VPHIHACVNLSAETTQRPTVGGEESIDKNKQRMTIPPRIVATHIPGTNLHTSAVQFSFQGKLNL